MKAFDVPSGERTLFVFTHPDDELVLAAFIARLVRGGTPVHVLWSHSTPLREHESRRVCAEIGLNPQDLTFLDAPDGFVLESLPRLRPLFESAVQRFAPTRAYVNAFEQGHIDHDATNLLVNLSFAGPVFEAPLYHTYLKKIPVLNRFSSLVGEQLMRLSADEVALKRKLVKMYPSQTVLRNVRLYTLAQLLMLKRPEMYVHERCRLQTHKDFLRPNHDSSLARKVESCPLWKRWVGVVSQMVTS